MALQPTKLVVFDFCESRASRHPADFLGHPGERAWRGTLVCEQALALFGRGEVAALDAERRRVLRQEVGELLPSQLDRPQRGAIVPVPD